jgi:hypothetical protein
MYRGITILYHVTLKIPDCMVKQQMKQGKLWKKNKVETIKANHNNQLIYKVIPAIPNMLYV